MPQMLDKEFDKQVRNLFVDAEIIPSAKVWKSIEAKLKPQTKKVFPIYWWAAASVIVTIATLLFFQKEEKIKLHGKEWATATKSEVKTLPDTMATAAKIAINADLSLNKKQTKMVSLPKTIVTEKHKTVTLKNNLRNTAIAMQPIEQDNHLAIKTTPLIAPEVLPNHDLVIGSQTMHAQATTESDNAKIADVETSEKKGIRNVGDLVNLVVDKLDKREKKIIQFNTDEDHTSIVALNIGILKFNKN